MERRWAIALVVVAVVTVGVLALAPTSTTRACMSTNGSAMRCTSSSTSLVDHEGSSVLFVLAVPVVLAAVAAAVPIRRVRQVVAVLLTVLMVLGMMTIGLFLAPIVALAWVLVYKTSASSVAK